MIPHKGGLRLPQESENYRILADWIADGAPGPHPSDAALENIEVLPGDMQLHLGLEQPLIVRAHYADGRIEDVTRWAKFSSANEAVAEVNEDGQIKILGPGKGAIVAWFASRIAIASIVVPYDNQVSKFAYRDFHTSKFIDEILLNEWQALNLVPSPGCTDATFIRRAYLDTTGTLPSPKRSGRLLGTRGG